MYKSIVVAVALFNKGATSRALIQKANKLLDAGGSITLVHVLDEVPAYLAAAVARVTKTETGAWRTIRAAVEPMK